MIAEYIFGLVITILAGWFAWQSSVLVSERKARYRAGTHDYYDNEIK